MQVTKEELEKLNDVARDTFRLSLNREPGNVAFYKSVAYYDLLIKQMLEKRGLDSMRYGINGITGAIVRCEIQ